MRRPRVYILYAPGTNCHEETADGFRLAGGDPVVCHLTSDLLNHRKRLAECDIIAIPGGFSFGDHVAEGRIFAIDLIYRLKDQLIEVLDKDILIIGICNGFQVLADTGLLPGNDGPGEIGAIIDKNLSAVFESRWVEIYAQETNCKWTEGIGDEPLRMPIAHGAGRVIIRSDYDENQTVFRYGKPRGTESYPDNPNGSPGGRAGICDPTGKILGLMPHPERAIYPWLGSEDGLKIFKAGIDAVK